MIPPGAEAKFIAALATTGNVTLSCKLAEFNRRAAYDRKNSDPAFAEKWEAALELGIDALEDEATRRALEGTEKPVFHQGVICGHVKEFSDTLMIFMLKSRRPEKFKDRISNEITGKLTLDQLVMASLQPPKE